LYGGHVVLHGTLRLWRYKIDTVKNRFSFSLVSLGCPKALVDSECILGNMVRSGFLLCEDPEDSDLVIVNTCCFIRDARDESKATIEEMLSLKAGGVIKAVIVYGCMPQRYGERIPDQFPGVDAVVGLAHRDQLPEVCRSILSGDRAANVMVSDFAGLVGCDSSRLRITPKHYAYLRISEGCSNRCAYCAIPDIRGPLRSRPVGELLHEARELVSDGAVEMILIGQDTAAYGTDISGSSMLHILVGELSQIEQLRWIRILYAHPAHIEKELIDVIAENDRVAKYLDIPVQHASNRILKNMGRLTRKEEILSLLRAMRKRIEGLVVRTSLIVGFPGESDLDFGELLDFVREAEFDRLGVFRYSREHGTPAFDFEDQVDEETKRRRYDELMKTQQKIAFKKNKAVVGKILPAIVDGQSDRKEYSYVGRTYGDAPDIDCRLYLAGRAVSAGEIVRATVLAADGYDLMGEIESGSRSTVTD
jgi:ribosomal protein S12 methylthiotransferase